MVTVYSICLIVIIKDEENHKIKKSMDWERIWCFKNSFESIITIKVHTNDYRNKSFTHGITLNKPTTTCLVLRFIHTNIQTIKFHLYCIDHIEQTSEIHKEDKISQQGWTIWVNGTPKILHKPVTPESIIAWASLNLPTALILSVVFFEK